MQIHLEFFCAKLQTDKQSNNIKNITSLVEVIKMYADTVQTYIHRHTHTHHKYILCELV